MTRKRDGTCIPFPDTVHTLTQRVVRVIALYILTVIPCQLSRSRPLRVRRMFDGIAAPLLSHSVPTYALTRHVRCSARHQ